MSFKGTDGKILQGISPPIASASANFACCYRLGRIVEGNERWKIAACRGNPCQGRSAPCRAHPGVPHTPAIVGTSSSVSPKGRYSTVEKSIFFFFPSLFLAPPPSRASVLVQQATLRSPELLCLKLSTCLKALPHREQLQEQLLPPQCQGCCRCQPARKQLLEGKVLALLLFK